MIESVSSTRKTILALVSLYNNTESIGDELYLTSKGEHTSSVLIELCSVNSGRFPPDTRSI